MSAVTIVPECWHVNTCVATNGDLYISVVRRGQGSQGNETDQEQVVPFGVPRLKWLNWLKFFYPSFEERATEAVRLAKKRAYVLNEQYSRAKRLEYGLKHPKVEKNLDG